MRWCGKITRAKGDGHATKLCRPGGRGGSLGERPREVQGSKECENDVNVSGRVQGMCARDGDTEMRLKGLFGQEKSVAGLK